MRVFSGLPRREKGEAHPSSPLLERFQLEQEDLMKGLQMESVPAAAIASPPPYSDVNIRPRQ